MWEARLVDDNGTELGRWTGNMEPMPDRLWWDRLDWTNGPDGARYLTQLADTIHDPATVATLNDMVRRVPKRPSMWTAMGA